MHKREREKERERERAMRFLGELAQARGDRVDFERESATWSTTSFMSYHGPDALACGAAGRGNRDPELDPTPLFEGLSPIQTHDISIYLTALACF